MTACPGNNAISPGTKGNRRMGEGSEIDQGSFCLNQHDLRGTWIRVIIM